MRAAFLRCARSVRVKWKVERVVRINVRKNTSSTGKDGSDSRLHEQTNVSERMETNKMESSASDISEEEKSFLKLQALSLSFLKMVDEAALNEQQLAVHRAHVQALKAGEMFYSDPLTGYQVMSRLAHLSRGDCCGNACRHCPFGQAGVSDELKGVYNSAFYER